jgi:hypothetical protein
MYGAEILFQVISERAGPVQMIEVGQTGVANSGNAVPSYRIR